LFTGHHTVFRRERENLATCLPPARRIADFPHSVGKSFASMTGDESPVYTTALAKASLSLIHQASSCRIHPRAGTQVSAIPHALSLRSGGVGVQAWGFRNGSATHIKWGLLSGSPSAQRTPAPIAGAV